VLKQYVEWNEFCLLAKSLAEKIKASSFHPETIHMVPRGGLVLGRLMTDLLNVKNLALTETFPTERRVLIVDEICDTGNTLLRITRGPLYRFCNIKTAVIHVKPWRKFNPDWWMVETSDWIVYPWEVFEE